MSWFDHPKFRRARDSVIESLHSKEFSFRKIKPIAFLCGGSNSPRREYINSFLRTSRSDLLVFYADKVWNAIAEAGKEDALAMEGELALLSDVVMVVVESPGTFTELGAFSIFPPLCEKLLVIMDSKHEHSESFINTGPVQAINAKSRYGPVVWADFDVVLDAADDILERLEGLVGDGRRRVHSLVDSDKHLLFFLCDLIAVFGPCSIVQLSYYCEQIVGAVDSTKLSRLVALAYELNLIRSIDLNSEQHFFRPLRDDEHPSFQETEYLSLPNQRATILSAMLKIQEAAKAIDEVAKL